MPSKKLYIGPQNVVDKNDKKWQNRILIGVPNTGIVRIEWVGARFSQTLPTNWSQGEMWQMMSSYMPIGYQIADAENLIAKGVVEGDYEWLLFIESDNLLPPNTFRKLNEYMLSKKYPIVGGLYFTKSVPPEPLVYRGRGNGYFDGWKFGDKVECDGLPFGCTLIHGNIIREIWKDSSEYKVNDVITRRVFNQPNFGWQDPVSGRYLNQGGTSDLDFCDRVMKGGYLAKAGFEKRQKEKYPFLVDTTIFVRHIDINGIQWPLDIPKKFEPSGERIEELMKEFSGPYK